jgi:hypothetical protein
MMRLDRETVETEIVIPDELRVGVKWIVEAAQTEGEVRCC